MFQKHNVLVEWFFNLLELLVLLFIYCIIYCVISLQQPIMCYYKNWVLQALAKLRLFQLKQKQLYQRILPFHTRRKLEHGQTAENKRAEAGGQRHDDESSIGYILCDCFYHDNIGQQNRIDFLQVRFVEARIRLRTFFTKNF